MNWRKKNSSSSSSALSSLSQALFPTSWVSKFKQMSKKQDHPHAKPMQDTKDQGKRNEGVVKSVFYDSHDEIENGFPFSSGRSCMSSTRYVNAKEGDQKFSDMVSQIRKMRVSNEGVLESQEKGFQTPRRRIHKGRKVTRRRKKDERILHEFCFDSGREYVEKSTDLVEKNILDMEALEAILMQESEFEGRKSKYISSSMTECGEKRELERDESEIKPLKVMSKSGKQRKSVYVSREVQGKRVKANCKVKLRSPRSPRTVSKIESCKIRALEDMKKAKTKKKWRIAEEGLALESFAVVKSSFDPQKDFRYSMVEMIEENGIWKAEELENLLACYLSLNSTEYHDLIVEVFRQVWFDMIQDCCGSDLQNVDHRISDF